MHRHGGLPLTRPELAAMYDAFETPRAVRGDLPLLDRAQALAYLDDVRARVPVEDSFLHDLVVRHEDQHQETMLQAIEMARLAPAPAVPRAVRPEAPGGHTGLESVEVPAGPCELGAPDGPLRLRQRAPAPPRRAARLPDRPHADHQRDLPALRRGRRLQAPPVVEPTRRGPGRRSTTSHTPRAGPTGPRVGAAGRSTAGRRSTRTSPWSTSPGSRPTPSPERTGPGCPPRRSGRRRRPGTRSGDGPRGRRAAHRRTSTTGCSARRRSGAYPEAAAPCGALGMLGDVWEWTSSPFRGYAGFVAHPYREYSEVFFGDRYRVLRGGSWATRSRVATPDLPQLGPAAAAADLLGSEAGMGRVERADLRIDVHVGAAAPRALPDDVLDGLTQPVQGAAAQAPLRRPRRRAVRPDLRAARVLPDAHRAGDPRRVRRGDRAPHRDGELVELGSGTAAKTRVLLDAMERAGTLWRYVPFDVAEQTVRDCAAALADEYAGPGRSTASSATSSAT